MSPSKPQPMNNGKTKANPKTLPFGKITDDQPTKLLPAKTQKVMLEHAQQLGDNFFEKSKGAWDE